MRLLCLPPAATEIACALGLRDRLVGRSHQAVVDTVELLVAWLRGEPVSPELGIEWAGAAAQPLPKGR